jgi:ACS family tartrate transporter-like MFS transporter
MNAISRSTPGSSLDTTTETAISKAKWRLMPLILLLYFIAFVDRVNVGFVGPILVGWIAQRTGNPASGLLFVAAAVVLAPIVILTLDRKKISETE